MSTPIELTVMRRVRTIHALRAVCAHLILLSGFFVVVLLAIGHEVWIGQVLQNMPSIVHIRSFIAFFVNAFLNTELMVQLYITLAVLVAIALIVDTVRLVRTLIPLRGLLLLFA